MELTLVDYDMVHYRPSEIAAASLCLSQLLFDGLPWVSLLDFSWFNGFNLPLCCFSLNPSVSSVSYAAALLDVRRGPPEANHAAHRQKRCDGERGENKVRGESADGEHETFWVEHEWILNTLFLCRLWRTSTRAASWWRSASSLSWSRPSSRTWRLLCSAVLEANFYISEDISLALYFRLIPVE